MHARGAEDGETEALKATRKMLYMSELEHGFFERNSNTKPYRVRYPVQDNSMRRGAGALEDGMNELLYEYDSV